MQRSYVVGQMDLDVVRIHHSVAVNVDLQRRVGSGRVDAGFGVRRPADPSNAAVSTK